MAAFLSVSGLCHQGQRNDISACLRVTLDCYGHGPCMQSACPWNGLGMHTSTRTPNAVCRGVRVDEGQPEATTIKEGFRIRRTRCSQSRHGCRIIHALTMTISTGVGSVSPVRVFLSVPSLSLGGLQSQSLSRLSASTPSSSSRSSPSSSGPPPISSSTSRSSSCGAGGEEWNRNRGIKGCLTKEVGKRPEAARAEQNDDDVALGYTERKDDVALRTSRTILESGNVDYGYGEMEQPRGSGLPSPPNVYNPRGSFNAAALAYLGDVIYELYSRRHYLYPPQNIKLYNERVMAVVRCEAQSKFLRLLLKERFFTETEMEILRWGRNSFSGSRKASRRAGGDVYSKATSLETLIGYLYLKDRERLEEMMSAIGFDSRWEEGNVGSGKDPFAEFLNDTEPKRKSREG